MQTVTLLTPTFNEVDNLEELIRRVWAAVEPLKDKYQFTYLFIDNDSTDGTRELLKKLAAADHRIKAIFNMRNFGHLHSPYYGLLQSQADATILLVADLQDPPEMIPKFIEKWEEGFKIALGVKNESEESVVFFFAQDLLRTGRKIEPGPPAEKHHGFRAIRPAGDRRPPHSGGPGPLFARDHL